MRTVLNANTVVPTDMTTGSAMVVITVQRVTDAETSTTVRNATNVSVTPAEDGAMTAKCASIVPKTRTSIVMNAVYVSIVRVKTTVRTVSDAQTALICVRTVIYVQTVQRNSVKNVISA